MTEEHKKDLALDFFIKLAKLNLVISAKNIQELHSELIKWIDLVAEETRREIELERIEHCKEAT